jgi:hypothetical protein
LGPDFDEPKPREKENSEKFVRFYDSRRNPKELFDEDSPPARFS